LAQAGKARIICVSSTGHLCSPVVFDDIHFRFRPYDPLLAYAQSKTAVNLFAAGAARRWAGDGITVNALNPGAIKTNLQRHVGGHSNRHRTCTKPYSNARQHRFSSPHPPWSKESAEGILIIATRQFLFHAAPHRCTNAQTSLPHILWTRATRIAFGMSRSVPSEPRDNGISGYSRLLLHTPKSLSEKAACHEIHFSVKVSVNGNDELRKIIESKLE
jgi:hypothetical protein